MFSMPPVLFPHCVGTAETQETTGPSIVLLNCTRTSSLLLYLYVDMSRAFDTIKQGKALEVLNMVGCNDDDHRLVRVLLVNTHLTIRVKGTQSA